MVTYEKPIISTILDRLNKDRKHLIIITGPRQTGKTTVLLQALKRQECPYSYLPVDEPEPSSLRNTLDDVFQETAVGQTKVATPISEKKDTRWLVRKWEQARIEANRSKQDFIIAFDEIQKIPEWSETIKGLWDADRRNDCPLQVILLGSAPLPIREGLGTSLVGRFEIIHLTHWSFAEMSEAFDFDLPSYIYFGGYPGGTKFMDNQNSWQKYINDSFIQPNIDQDILAMQRVRKPALLKRLIEIVGYYSGQIFSYNKMLGQLTDAGNTTTLAHYLNLLSSTGLATGIPKYSSGSYLRKASSPKLNVLNTAIMSVNSGYTFEEAMADRSFWGCLVESTIGAHLFNTGTPEIQLYYWRRNGHKVDFVLEFGRKLVAFEVKSGAQKSSTSGLKEFRKRFNPLRCEVVGGKGIPLEEFLLTPAENWFKSS